MILSDLLTATVSHRGERIGYVTDVRLRMKEDQDSNHCPAAVIHGLIVSPHTRSSSMGFERTGVRSPWPVAAWQRWTHRDSFLIPWSGVAEIQPHNITLRADVTRYSAMLPGEGGV